MNIEWHKFSFDSMPPLNIGILITDGNIITVTEIGKWKHGTDAVNKIKSFWMISYGFSGHEWEYDFDITQITHWALLPDMPNKET